MKKLSALLILFLAASIQANAQAYLNQNGLQTSVIGSLSANSTQARRYEIATIGYNSHHWQGGGVIMVELFGVSYQPGYEKYIIEVGYGRGANWGAFSNKLVESQGAMHNARVVLGEPYDLPTSGGGYVNRALPVYVDVRYYSGYQAKITYLHNLVDQLDNQNQIKIHTAGGGNDIPDFTAPVVAADVNSSGNLLITGAGDHYIQNGKVGIGITTPETKLHVSGATTTDLLTMAEGGTHIGYFGRGGSITGGWSQTPSALTINYHSRDFAIGGWSKTNPTWMGAALYINSDNNHVGIGTTQPDAKLTVKGKIHAEEVKVDLNVPGPDYVFEKDYQLKSLAEVEKYVNANKHLPEIPSAKTMEKEGISMGEMQMKLLQKIEELTLHLIQKDKEMKDLRDRMASLESRIK